VCREAKIIFGKFLNNWAVLYPGGRVVQCKNYSTAKYYKDIFNNKKEK